MDDWTPRTLAVSAGRPHGPGEPLNTPIVPASNFEAGGDFTYARSEGTPTWVALEEAVGALEGGHATAFASGVATLSAVLDLLPVGSRVAVPTFSYAVTRGALAHAEGLGRLSVVELEPGDTEAWLACDADLLWLESPTNPTLDLMDIETIARGTRGRVVVDNTFERPDAASADKVCASVRLIRSATSLGGVESLVERRNALAGEERVPPGLIRFSVGLEDPEDLWRDLAAALSDR